jgi:hypothetical protein
MMALDAAVMLPGGKRVAGGVIVPYSSISATWGVLPSMARNANAKVVKDVLAHAYCSQ